MYNNAVIYICEYHFSRQYEFDFQCDKSAVHSCIHVCLHKELLIWSHVNHM